MATASKTGLVRGLNLQYLIAFTFGILMFFICAAASNLAVHWLSDQALVTNVAVLNATAFVVNTLVYAAGLAALLWELREFGFRPTAWAVGLGATLAGGLIVISQLVVSFTIRDINLPTNEVATLQLILFGAYGVVYGVSLWAAQNLDLPQARS